MPTTTGVATSFIDFTRASNATVTDSDGVIKWAAHNLLQASEQFDASSWTKAANVTITANAGAAPNGTTTADRAATSGASAAITQLITCVVGEKYKINVWAKSFGGSNQTIRLMGDTGILSADLTVTSSWQLFELEVTVATGGSRSFGITAGTAFANYDILVWGAHLYRSDLGGMQANTSAYPMYNPTTPKNLLGFTEDWTNAAWVVDGSSAATNVANAINGLMTADRVSETAVTSAHAISQTLTLAAGRYTYSVYLKKGTGATAPDWVQLTFGGNSSDWANFNLTGSGSVGNSSSVGIAAITAVSDGWYRCSLAMSPAAGASSVQIVFTNNTNSASRRPSYAGTTTSDVLVWGAQLSDSASLDTYVANHFTAPSAAAYYGPRRDFDSAGVCKGLLVEEQRANLLLHTAAFDNAAWSKIAATVAANAVTSPDGTLTADTLTENTATATAHNIIQSGGTVGVAETFSVYAKPNGRNWIALQLGGTHVVYYDIQNGVLGNVTAGATATINSAGNGWYRCSMTATRATNTNNNILLATGNSAFSYNGDGTSGVHLWGAQLEPGSFATSYIPVGATTAGATRNGDVASVSTQAFPYSATESTLVANCTLLGSSSSSGVIAALQLAASPGGLLLFRSSNSLATVAWVDASFAALGTADTTNQQKLALAYNGTANGSVRNGGTVSSVGTTISGPATKLVMGCDFNNSSQLNGHIRQITYLPRRISNTELQSRTA